MLEDLRAFVKTAELGSYTKAAEQLGLSKSRVSLKVRGLEDTLGAALLQRSTRAVQLTSAGEALLPRARQLLADAEDVGAMFRAQQSLGGELRVDLPVSLANTVVIPRLPELYAAHPKLALYLSTSDRRVDVVKDGFDCVLRVGKLRDSSLFARRVATMDMVNAASPAYLRRFGTPTSPKHLSAHRIVHYGGGEPAFEANGKDIPVASVLTVNGTDAYQTACLAGLGIIQSPRFGLRRHLASGALIEILTRFPAASMPVSLVYAQRTPSKLLRAFMDWLAGVVGAALHSK